LKDTVEGGFHSESRSNDRGAIPFVDAKGAVEHVWSKVPPARQLAKKSRMSKNQHQ
jgi:hypothetical protein